MECKKLIGTLSAERMLIFAPLLRWYLDHGLIITKVYRAINYKQKRNFKWIVDKVTDARRSGDVDKSKALFAEIFKLLGNTQTITCYTQDASVVDKSLRSTWFEDLEDKAMLIMYKRESL